MELMSNTTPLFVFDKFPSLFRQQNVLELKFKLLSISNAYTIQTSNIFVLLL